MKRHVRIALFPLVLPLLTGCGGDAAGAPRAERTDSVGVTIIRNVVEDRPLDWRLDHVLSLGGAEQGPESFYNVFPGSVATDAAGRLYVLDAGNHRVVVFDSAGTPLRTMGSQGGGPGEIEMPLAFSVAPDGTVSVFDLGKRGFVRWGPDGEPLPSEPLELPYRGGPIVRTASATVLPVRDFDPETQQITETLLAIRGADTTEIVAVPNPPAEMRDFGCVQMNLPPMFTPSLTWTAAGDTVLANAGAGYAVDLYQQGRQSASIRRDVPPRPVTREMALQEVGDEMKVTFGGQRAECNIPAERVVEAQGYAPVLPAVKNVAVDPAGRIWVHRGHVKDEPAPIDLFAPDGEYLGTLPSGTPYPAAFTPGGDIIAVETDELDLPHVVVYRLVQSS